VSAPTLWPFQVELLDRVEKALDDGEDPLVQLPTGGGKTITFSELIRRRGGRALVLAHRTELIQQAASKLFAAGVDVGIIQAGIRPSPIATAQVASVQTLAARLRRGAIELSNFGTVVVDEAHHVVASSWKDILAACPHARVVGWTATPVRGDGRGLGGVFDTLITGPSVTDLIIDGYLVPVRPWAPTAPDLAGVRVQAGGYAPGALAERMDKPKLVGDVVTHWLRLAERRKTLVFASGVAHGVHLCEEFGRAGVVAENIHAGTPPEERADILRRFAAGQVEVITNALIFVEGFDCPDIGAVVLARPTRSLSLYLQMVGRGLRRAPGKKNCILIDHASAVHQHGYPDDPIIWPLEKDDKAVDVAHKARQDGKAPGLVDCPECGAIRLAGQPCPACGWRPQPKPVAVTVVDGELARADRARRTETSAPSDDDKLRFYAELLGLAAEYGWKPGAAFYKFQEKFKAKPPSHNVTPIPPSAATRSWVRSRQIAYKIAM
jgi:superfamily II DNA or RNA helicase